ncbi:hypothetical protein LV779_34375 [Streptomyces thinghirensis]|nr:hypothetical protein [Streptomyces thinghirensis]
MAYRIIGPLDRQAYARALEALVARHAVLRTGYLRRGGTYVQQVNDANGFRRRLRGRRATARSPSSSAPNGRGRSGPRTRHALRVHILTLTGRTKHIAVVTRPWGIFDGWSTGVFIAELNALYRAFEPRRGHRSCPNYRVQYAGLRALAGTEPSTPGPAHGRWSYWRSGSSPGLPARTALRTDYAAARDQVVPGLLGGGEHSRRSARPAQAGQQGARRHALS